MQGTIRTRRKLNLRTGEWEEEKEYLIDGKRVSAKVFAKKFPDKPLGSFVPGNWLKPVHSDALGVHTDDIKEAHEDARKKGLATEFDGSGRPIFHNSREKQAYCRAYGFFDRKGVLSPKNN